MPRVDGSLARKLDFGDVTTTCGSSRSVKAELRLAVFAEGVRGPDKYKVLEHRRRQAQIKARRFLDLI